MQNVGCERNESMTSPEGMRDRKLGRDGMMERGRERASDRRGTLLTYRRIVHSTVYSLLTSLSFLSYSVYLTLLTALDQWSFYCTSMTSLTIA